MRRRHQIVSAKRGSERRKYQSPDDEDAGRGHTDQRLPQLRGRSADHAPLEAR